MPISGACPAAEKGPMLKALRFRSAFCFATIGMLMLIPATASAQALQGYVKNKGIKQGQFKGEGAPSSAPTNKRSGATNATNKQRFDPYKNFKFR